MAFASMFLVFLGFVVILLGGMFFLGLLLLIIGIVRRKNPKNAGKKSPIVAIVLGVLLLMPPVGTGLFIGGVIVKDFIVSHRDYEVVTDEWRAHYVVPGEAVRDVTEGLLEAAEDNDKELIAKLFTKSARESLGFERTYHNTKENQYYSETLSVMIDGEEYYVYAYFCLKNEDPDEIGLIFFCLQNEKGYQERFDFSNQTIACLVK